MTLWGLASAGAVLAFSLTPAFGIAALAVGAVAILGLSADAVPVRVATVAATLPAAADWSVAAWALPAAAAIVALLPAPRRALDWGLDELQRHLDRSRRRDESVHLLFAGAVSATGAFDERELVGLLRLSDSVWLRGSGEGQHLVAVVDDHNLERAGVERRLAAAARGPISVGWAQFPADGASLERLLEHARADAASRPSGAPAMTGARSPAEAVSPMTRVSEQITNLDSPGPFKGNEIRTGRHGRGRGL